MFERGVQSFHTALFQLRHKNIKITRNNQHRYTTGCKPAPSKEPDFSVFLPRDDDDEETAVITSSTKEFSSTISTTGQKHFYMETQSTLVVPNKSADSIVVTCATQCLTSIHNELSKTLDLKASNITVGSSRVFYYFQSYVTHLATHTHTHTRRYKR